MTDGIQIEINQAEVERQARALAVLLVDDKETRKKIRKVIQSEITKARTRASRDVRSMLKNDPRQAYKAVKRSVWRKTLGGSLSILSQRRAGAANVIEPAKTLNPSAPGGNRRARSERTWQLMGYYGKDRGFVLRFLNAGTGNRSISFKADPHREKVKRGSRGGNVSKYGKTTNTGARGSITAGNFFNAIGGTNLDIASANIAKMIDEELTAAFKAEQNS